MQVLEKRHELLREAFDFDSIFAEEGDDSATDESGRKSSASCARDARDAGDALSS